MKQYLQGFGCIAGAIVLSILAGFPTHSRLPKEDTAVIVTGAFLVSMVAVGYIYKRWNGPLFFAADGKAFERLFPFLLGVGTLLGPTKLALGTFPIPNVIPLVNLILLLLSVPLAGASALGAMLIGSVFYKREPTWL